MRAYVSASSVRTEVASREQSKGTKGGGGVTLWGGYTATVTTTAKAAQAAGSCICFRFLVRSMCV